MSKRKAQSTYKPRPHHVPFRRHGHKEGHVERIDVMAARQVLAHEIKALEADRDFYKKIACLMIIEGNYIIQRPYYFSDMHDMALSGPWLSYETTDPQTGVVLRDHTTGKIKRVTSPYFRPDPNTMERIRRDITRSGINAFTDVLPIMAEYGLKITHQGGKEY